VECMAGSDLSKAKSNGCVRSATWSEKWETMDGEKKESERENSRTAGEQNIVVLSN